MENRATPTDQALRGIVIINIVTLLWALWQEWSVLLKTVADVVVMHKVEHRVPAARDDSPPHQCVN